MTAGDWLSMEATGKLSIDLMDCLVKKVWSSFRIRLTASFPWNIPLNFDMALSIYNQTCESIDNIIILRHFWSETSEQVTVMKQVAWLTWNLGIWGWLATEGFSERIRSADISADFRLKSDCGTNLTRILPQLWVLSFGWSLNATVPTSRSYMRGNP